jgi:copper resistance protein C
MKRLVLGSVALLASVLTFVAGAHTTVERTNPADGAVLERSPQQIEIKFKHSVHMTSIVVIAVDQTERKLTFSPTAGAETVIIDNPGLQVGRNEIRWTALSKDGHVINGTVVYIIKPASSSP